MTLRDVLNLMMRIPLLCDRRDVVAEIDACFHGHNPDVRRAYRIASAQLPENIRPHLFYTTTEFFDRGWYHMFLVHNDAPDILPGTARCYTLPCLVPFEKFPSVTLSICYQTRDGLMHQTAKFVPRTGSVYIGAPHVDHYEQKDEDRWVVRDMNTHWMHPDL